MNPNQAIITAHLIKVQAAPMDPAVLVNNIQALRAMNFPGAQMKSDTNPTLAKLATLFFSGQLNPIDLKLDFCVSSYLKHPCYMLPLFKN
jgi:hypothetical protein